jgi:hypothetical protein
LSKRRVKDGSSDATGRSFPKGKNPGRNPTPGDDEPAPERAGECIPAIEQIEAFGVTSVSKTDVITQATRVMIAANRPRSITHRRNFAVSSWIFPEVRIPEVEIRFWIIRDRFLSRWRRWRR